MTIRKLNYKQWNRLPLDDETKYEANMYDICYRIGYLYACCITNGEVNNIIIWSPYYDISNVKSALQFIKILYLQYNISYIRVEGKKGRYHFFKQLFGMNMLWQPLDNGRDAFYCLIDNEVVKKINSLTNVKRKVDRTKVSDETRERLSKARKGMHFSDEWRKNLSISLKGKRPWNKGMHFSDETRKKMSESAIKRWNKI